MTLPVLLKSTLAYASLFLQGLTSFNNSHEVGFDGKWDMPVVHPSKIKERTNCSLATPCKR